MSCLFWIVVVVGYMVWICSLLQMFCFLGMGNLGFVGFVFAVCHWVFGL